MAEANANPEIRGEALPPNTLEEKAATLGWKPQDQWEGSPDEWRGAKEFVDRQSLFDKIDSLKSTIWELKKDYKDVWNKVSQSERSRYDAEIASLKAERKQAAKEGDTEKVVEISERLETAQATIPQPQQQQGPDPLFEQWVKENPWYTSKENLREDADDFGIAYKAKNPNASFQDVLNHVTKKVKDLHKEDFAPKKAAVSTVESGTGTPVKKTSKYSEADLSEVEREVMNKMVKLKIYGDIPIADAKAKYILSLAKAKEK